MRSLSSTLLAAQRSASGEPFVTVEVLDMVAGVVRPSFSRFYTGTEPDFHHTATMPGDSSLVRARVQTSSNNLYVQRVANPGSQSDYTNWTLVEAVYSGCNVALCSQGALVLLFYVDPTNAHTIYLRESSDYGVTWGARQTVLSPAVNLVKWVAAAFSTGGTPALFFASDAHVVYVTKRVSGQWSSPTPWTNTVSTLTGLGCTYSGDWYLALTGKNTGGDWRVWTCLYGDGDSQASNTWSTLRDVAEAAGDSSVEFQAPFLTAPDVSRLSYIEKFNGSFSYSRPLLAHALAGTSFLANRWRYPAPFDLSSSYGLAMAHGGSNLWLTTPFGVWKGSLSGVSVDVSKDVVELRSEDTPTQGRLTITLRNDDGRYASIGSGTYAAIKVGSEVRMSPGYVTASGSETSAGPGYWISGWEYLSQAGRALFRLHAVDAWGILASWHARSQYSWTPGEKSVQDILTSVLNHLGLTVTTLSSSTTMTSHKPAFTIHPHESAATAVRLLLSLVPDTLFFRGYQAFLKYPQTNDPTDYSFGTNHALLQGRYSQAALQASRVQVYGSAGMAESFDWPSIPLLGDLLLQLHDLNLDSQAKAQERADQTVRRLGMEAIAGGIMVPPNCGQELYDVVEITDSRAGLSATKQRVQGIVLQYQRQKEPRYVQLLALGGV